MALCLNRLRTLRASRSWISNLHPTVQSYRQPGPLASLATQLAARLKVSTHGGPLGVDGATAADAEFPVECHTGRVTHSALVRRGCEALRAQRCLDDT